MPLNEKTISDHAHLLKNLQDKQIWHITAPAGVSLQSLKEMALDTAMNGETVLEYKGAGYGFCKKDKSEEDGRQILIPYNSGYKAGTHHINVLILLGIRS